MELGAPAPSSLGGVEGSLTVAGDVIELGTTSQQRHYSTEQLLTPFFSLKTSQLQRKMRRSRKGVTWYRK